ncbi:hypothetical protein FB451DRAFT_1163775 [Mycena latifolia]|nr:hypothetical protein FB451DRAFT_1163775 [Mycena latifolia]
MSARTAFPPASPRASHDTTSTTTTDSLLPDELDFQESFLSAGDHELLSRVAHSAQRARETRRPRTVARMPQCPRMEPQPRKWCAAWLIFISCSRLTYHVWPEFNFVTPKRYGALYSAWTKMRICV